MGWIKSYFRKEKSLINSGIHLKKEILYYSLFLLDLNIYIYIFELW